MTIEKIRILLIEDDEELALLIANYLRKAEFDVEMHHSGIGAQQRIIELKPDLVILDLMLPGIDGISICRETRPYYEGKIMMLTASQDSVDQIVGLEIGADDFIQKPVEPRLLLARTRALVRRPTYMNDQHVSDVKKQNLLFGNIKINTADRLVKIQEQTVDLATQEYDVLMLLVESKGDILTRNNIFQSLRGIDYDGQNRLVDILVSQLRAKLSIDGQSGKHVKTIRNKGYLFVESIS